MPLPFSARWCTSFALVVSALTATQLLAQAPERATRDSAAAVGMKVFLDCLGETQHGCAPEFFVTELPWVTWTRDRLFADVQFLVTTIQAGSGAYQYTVTAIGRGQFAGRADTATIATLPNESEDGVRRKLAHNVALMLVPYVRTRAVASRLSLVYAAPNTAQDASPVSARDAWNHFVVQLESNGFVSTESRQTSGNLFTDLQVRRITDKSSLRVGVNQSARFSKFQLDDSTTVSTTIQQGVLFGRGVLALSPRLSVGLISNLGYSEFNNTRLAWRLAPVLEYNFFPWSQATSQQVVVSYGVGPRYFRWRDSTIFGESREWRAQQELVIATDIRKSWGNVSMSARYASFLPDAQKWNLGVTGRTSLNLVKGLSFNIGGGASLIRDQIFLAAAGQTPAEILTQRRALASNYSAFLFTGLSFSFGSIYNNIVNPRLEFFNLGGNN